MKLTKSYMKTWKMKLRSKSPYHEEWRIYDKNSEFIGGFVESVDFLDVTDSTGIWLALVDGSILIGKKNRFMKDKEIYEALYKSIEENIDLFNYNHGYKFTLN